MGFQRLQGACICPFLIRPTSLEPRPSVLFFVSLPRHRPVLLRGVDVVVELVGVLLGLCERKNHIHVSRAQDAPPMRHGTGYGGSPQDV